MVMDLVSINLTMLHTFVENQIACDLNSIPVVTLHVVGLRMRTLASQSNRRSQIISHVVSAIV